MPSCRWLFSKYRHTGRLSIVALQHTSVIAVWSFSHTLSYLVQHNNSARVFRINFSVSRRFARGAILANSLTHQLANSSNFTQIDQALRQEKPPKSEDPEAGGLAAARVLLVHSGGDSQRSPTQCVCGKAWSALNSCSGRDNMCNTPMDLLLDHLSRLFQSGLAPGTLVVTACDVMLLVPPEVAATADWSFDSNGGVAGLAIAADAAKYAPNHGVYCLDRGAHEGGGGGEKNAIAGVSRWCSSVGSRESKLLYHCCETI